MSEGYVNWSGGDNSAPGTTRAAPARALNTTFVCNTARPVLVAYSVRVSTPAAGDSGKVELLSDAAATPTTVLATFGAAAASGGGTGGIPEVMGSIDGVTTPGTPTFTGFGVSAIVQNAAGTGVYDLTLTTAIHLENGAACQGVLNTSPIEGHDGTIPPGAGVGSIIRYEVTDPTHITLICQSNMLTAKDAKFGITVERFSPVPTAAAGAGNSNTGILVGIVYPGHTVRVQSTTTAGAPTFALSQVMEATF